MKKSRIATIVTAAAVAAVTAVVINKTKHNLFSLDEDLNSDLFEDEDTEDNVKSARSRFTNVLSRVVGSASTSANEKTFADSTEENE
jgi:hypothetical protein